MERKRRFERQQAKTCSLLYPPRALLLVPVLAHRDLQGAAEAALAQLGRRALARRLDFPSNALELAEARAAETGGRRRPSSFFRRRRRTTSSGGRRAARRRRWPWRARPRPARPRLPPLRPLPVCIPAPRVDGDPLKLKPITNARRVGLRVSRLDPLTPRPTSDLSSTSTVKVRPSPCLPWYTFDWRPAPAAGPSITTRPALVSRRVRAPERGGRGARFLFLTFKSSWSTTPLSGSICSARSFSDRPGPQRTVALVPSSHCSTFSRGARSASVFSARCKRSASRRSAAADRLALSAPARRGRSKSCSSFSFAGTLRSRLGRVGSAIMLRQDGTVADAKRVAIFVTSAEFWLQKKKHC